MTESIQRKIEQIGEKVKSLHTLLIDQRQENERLQAELEKSKSDFTAKEEELALNRTKLNALQEELTSQKEQNTVSSVPASQFNESEIDELVKEIEYCIGQLKK